jgi:hypothetical protein
LALTLKANASISGSEQASEKPGLAGIPFSIACTTENWFPNIQTKTALTLGQSRFVELLSLSQILAGPRGKVDASK